MKTIIALLLVSAHLAVAGTLQDNANLFGPDKARVDAALAKSKVWVETMVKRPDDLKSWADTRIEQLGEGFLIVITTQPKAWRISMYPVGLAASPRTEATGNKMASRFKEGRMADGVIAAANELTAMTKPTGSIPSPPMSGGAKAAVWIGAALIALFGGWLAIFVIGTIRKNARDRQAAEAEQDRKDAELAAAREERERERRREREREARPKPPMPSGGIRQAPLYPKAPTRKAPPSPEPNPYEDMSPAQRKEVVHHYVHDHRYHDGLLSDPVAFLLFMNMVQSQHQAPVQQVFTTPPAPAFTPAPRRREPEPEPEIERSTPSYRPEPSRSDESGSGGSWSSGGSSDSGGGSSASDSSSAASSDSSGSGGSW